MAQVTINWSRYIRESIVERIEREERKRAAQETLEDLRTRKHIARQRKWLPARLWDEIIQKMPVPCVDLILQRPNDSILYGWRLISPYRNVWALVGGRMLRGENLLQSASRIAREYGLRVGRLYLNGVFPVNFPRGTLHLRRTPS